MFTKKNIPNMSILLAPVPVSNNASIQIRDPTSPSNETVLFLGLDGVSTFKMSRRCIKCVFVVGVGGTHLLMFQRMSMKKGCQSMMGRTEVYM